MHLLLLNDKPASLRDIKNFLTSVFLEHVEEAT